MRAPLQGHGVLEPEQLWWNLWGWKTAGKAESLKGEQGRRYWSVSGTVRVWLGDSSS